MPPYVNSWVHTADWSAFCSGATLDKAVPIQQPSPDKDRPICQYCGTSIYQVIRPDRDGTTWYTWHHSGTNRTNCCGLTGILAAPKQQPSP